MRHALAIALLVACGAPQHMAYVPARYVIAVWHRERGYARDLCATGAWTGDPDVRRKHAEVYELAVTFADVDAARGAVKAADLDPDDFEYREVRVP